MVILFDNGHGIGTAGKRSPDGSLREYKWTREAAREAVRRLKAEGLDARLLVPEEEDIALGVRTRRANSVCREAGSGNVVLVSVHNDAAGADGRWRDARGFSARVSCNASRNSKRLARDMMKAAAERGLSGNRCVPAAGYWEQNLAICRDTLCPAVLVECLFQDNREDVAFLLSAVGREAVVSALIAGVKSYLKGE